MWSGWQGQGRPADSGAGAGEVGSRGLLSEYHPGSGPELQARAAGWKGWAGGKKTVTCWDQTLLLFWLCSLTVASQEPSVEKAEDEGWTVGPWFSAQGCLGKTMPLGLQGLHWAFWSKSLDLEERWPVLSVSEPRGSSVTMQCPLPSRRDL